MGGGEGNKEIFEEKKLKRNFSEVIGKIGRKNFIFNVIISAKKILVIVQTSYISYCFNLLIFSSIRGLSRDFVENFINLVRNTNWKLGYTLFGSFSKG